MFENVLVAIDQSDLNEKIVDAAIELAGLSGAVITLINVHPAPIAPAYPYDITRDYIDTVNESLTKESEALLEKAKQVLLMKNPAVIVKTVSLTGNPATAMLEYAETTNQGVIVIGSRGLRGIKGMLLGSVSSKIAQLATCPVLIIH